MSKNRGSKTSEPKTDKPVEDTKPAADTSGSDRGAPEGSGETPVGADVVGADAGSGDRRVDESAESVPGAAGPGEPEAPPAGETGRELEGDEAAAAIAAGLDGIAAGLPAPGDTQGEATEPPPLRTDGPTIERYVVAGYAAENYPPSGYAEVASPGLERFRAGGLVFETEEAQGAELEAYERETAAADAIPEPPPAPPAPVEPNAVPTPLQKQCSHVFNDEGQCRKCGFKARQGAKHEPYGRGMFANVTTREV